MDKKLAVFHLFFFTSDIFLLRYAGRELKHHNLGTYVSG